MMLGSAESEHPTLTSAFNQEIFVNRLIEQNVD